jgi:hypothetical protein
LRFTTRTVATAATRRGYEVGVRDSCFGHEHGRPGAVRQRQRATGENASEPQFGVSSPTPGLTGATTGGGVVPVAGQQAISGQAVERGRLVEQVVIADLAGARWT